MKIKNFWLDLITADEMTEIGLDRMKWYEENIVCLLIQDQKDFFKSGYKDIEGLWPGVRVLSAKT